MDIALALIFIFCSLLFSVYKGINLVYPLFMGLLLLIFTAKRRGFELKDLLSMSYRGSKKSLVVIRVFVLIGAITAVWRASGTVALIVYHGIELMNPDYFILYAFVLSSIVSFLLGTAFGTVGTIGIVLMILAKGGSVDINIAAGAIIAGAYFGDRCSPMSSSAVLVASLTETDLYSNIKNMFKSAIIPLLITLAAYTILSIYNPLSIQDNSISNNIAQNFSTNIAGILPAAVILIMAAFRVDVKLSMLASIIVGMILAYVFQGYSVQQILKFTVFGFSLESGGMFNDIIKGGGILSMVKVALIVMISSAYSGIFEGTQMLKEIQKVLDSIANRYGTFAAAIISSIITAALGCTQTIAILLSNQLIKETYSRSSKTKQELALDLENSAVVISPLLPWNIAAGVPAATLSATAGFIPFAFYLYLIPISHYLYKRLNKAKINENSVQC